MTGTGCLQQFGGQQVELLHDVGHPDQQLGLEEVVGGEGTGLAAKVQILLHCQGGGTELAKPINDQNPVSSEFSQEQCPIR